MLESLPPPPPPKKKEVFLEIVLRRIRALTGAEITLRVGPLDYLCYGPYWPPENIRITKIKVSLF